MASGKAELEVMKLVDLSVFLENNIKAFVSAWVNEAASAGRTPMSHPDYVCSREMFDARRNLISAAGSLVNIVCDPKMRLMEISSQYFESRALHLIAERKVADRLAQGGNMGVSIKDLSVFTHVEPGKLSRLMRCLCSIGVFEEIKENVYINNAISDALVGDDEFRNYITMYGYDMFTCADQLPTTLVDKKRGWSYSVRETPFQAALSTYQSRWDWLDNKLTEMEYAGGLTSKERVARTKYSGIWDNASVDASNLKDDMGRFPRPELANFSLAMIGGGRVSGRSHAQDYPWHKLGAATVVDVGGGMGGFCLSLAKMHKSLKFVLQDRAAVINDAKNNFWPKADPRGSLMARVKFMDHDFFQLNPVRDADIYWMRSIVHDWSDKDALRILCNITAVMKPTARVLIADHVMNTTVGDKKIPSAHKALLPNYGTYMRWSHHRDLAMMSTINGVERTPQQFKTILDRAGLIIKKFWDCRSQVSIIECVLDRPLQVNVVRCDLSPKSTPNGKGQGKSTEGPKPEAEKNEEPEDAWTAENRAILALRATLRTTKELVSQLAEEVASKSADQPDPKPADKSGSKPTENRDLKPAERQ